MILVYLDASVWVKRYVLEEESERVRRWLREGPVVATSSLALIEVMSTLVRKERAGELETEDMETSLDSAEADFEHFAAVPLSKGVTNNARLLSRQYGLRGADTLSSCCGTLDWESLHSRKRSDWARDFRSGIDRSRRARWAHGFRSNARIPSEPVINRL